VAQPTRKTWIPLALLATACSSGPAYQGEDVRWLVDHGYFDEAVRVASQAVQAAPDDPAAQAAHRDVTVAWWIERGRRLTFEDEDEQALEAFQAALVLAPESQVARSWVRKTQLKIAELAFRQAIELHANDRMPEALEAYERALVHDPEDENAQIGRRISQRLLQHRAGLGSRYFRDGLEASSRYWLEYARARYAYAEKYQGENGRAGTRKREVQRLLAVQRIAAGRTFEEQASFGAARGEYRIALTFDPDSADALEGLERAQLELEVSEQIKRARMEIVRGRLEKAEEMGRAALERTQAQRDAAEGLLAEVREQRLADLYGSALSLERDGRYEESLERFDALLAESEYFRDAITRRDTLREYVRRAAELYERAQASADQQDKVALLRQIELFWPEYRDVRAQLSALETGPAEPGARAPEARRTGAPGSEAPASDTRNPGAREMDPRF
jgi:tetratricopeptide (TPR) repeat protein